ncbi:hypothetical protein NMY22_g5782 [Coprinellus aureogranulatus]|nr:hypothetical protein NMY22_g5782 [Coprinellus aureogranulatus]
MPTSLYESHSEAEGLWNPAAGESNNPMNRISQHESNDAPTATFTGRLTTEQQRLISLVDRAVDFNLKYLSSLRVAFFDPQDPDASPCSSNSKRNDMPNLEPDHNAFTTLGYDVGPGITKSQFESIMRRPPHLGRSPLASTHLHLQRMCLDQEPHKRNPHRRYSMHESGLALRRDFETQKFTLPNASAKAGYGKPHSKRKGGGTAICQHPFLFESVEDKANPTGFIDEKLIGESGKVELLGHRILPKFFATRCRALIFFRMTKEAISVAKTEHLEVVDDLVTHKPKTGGLIDSRKGTIDQPLQCQACHEGMVEYPRRFGHIELARLVSHPGFIVKMDPNFADKIRHIRDPKARMAVVWAHCKTKMVCETDEPKEEGQEGEAEEPERATTAAFISSHLSERRA